MNGATVMTASFNMKFLFFLLMLLSSIGGYHLYMGLNNNFHEVLPGELYRSAQPDAEDLANYQKKYGIRSILNLRGENPDKHWYQEEVASAARFGLTHYDFGMSAKYMLTEEQARRLVQIMRDAPKPLLIHCASGANRSGLATALYLIATRDEPIYAKLQLSPYYGHYPFSFLKEYAMTRSFEQLAPITKSSPKENAPIPNAMPAP